MMHWYENTWLLTIVVWLSFTIMICVLAEQRYKQIVGALVVTLWIWGVTLSGLYNAGFLVPVPIRLPSPTIRITYTIEPPNIQKTQPKKP